MPVEPGGTAPFHLDASTPSDEPGITIVRRAGSLRIAITLVVLALAATGAGCGAGAKPGPTNTLRLDADPRGAPNFTTSHLNVAAGIVQLRMSNPSPVPHAIAIEGHGISSIGAVVGRNSTSAVTSDLRAGTYTFYCPVPGHRQAGMTGTLTVG